jgi:hypothetical protein
LAQLMPDGFLVDFAASPSGLFGFAVAGFGVW